MIITYDIHEEIAIYTYLSQVQLARRVYKYLKSQQGLFLVNGEPKEVNFMLKSGDTLSLVFPKESLSPCFEPYQIALDILYEDAYFLILNKPSGLATIPTQAHPKVNLANAVAHYYLTHNIASNIHFVNRLDKDTSGVIMLAKHRYIHHVMQETLHDSLHRTYVARVDGIIASSGSIDAPIAKAQEGIKREVSFYGKPALTYFSRIACDASTSQVLLTLKTGRTHQLRVHLAHIGHPIVGDSLYGTPNTRLHLHSNTLVFTHPMTGKVITLTASTPF